MRVEWTIIIGLGALIIAAPARAKTTAEPSIAPTGTVVLGQTAQVVELSTFMTGQGSNLEVTYKDMRTGKLHKASTPAEQDNALLMTALTNRLPAELHINHLSARGRPYRASFRTVIGRSVDKARIAPTGSVTIGRDATVVGLSTFSTGQGSNLEISYRPKNSRRIYKASSVSSQTNALLLQGLAQGIPVKLQIGHLSARNRPYRATYSAVLQPNLPTGKKSMWPAARRRAKGKRTPRR